MNVPSFLRVEHCDYPLGLTSPSPRLSWRLPRGAREQTAYQICVDGVASRPVFSRDSILVPYPGPPPSSGQRVEWTVKVWTDRGESEWAPPCWWEAGLLRDDWTARWIEPYGASSVRGDRPHPAWQMRREFVCPEPPTSARLYATAHGIYELFINGQRVGDQELTPGFTDYDSTLHVQTYDVGSLLREGPNTLEALLSGGWMTWTRRFRGSDHGIALLAQLRVQHASGRISKAETDEGWRSARAPLKTADLKQGQVMDFRDGGVQGPGRVSTTESWQPVLLRDYGLARLSGSPAPPVRRVERLRPINIRRLRSGSQVVDFGQNINGWVQLRNIDAPSGTTIELHHGETLSAEGALTVDHLLEEQDGRARFQVDEVTLAGQTPERFEPRHTTHGFRYVQVTGHPGSLTAADIDAIAVHTDMRRRGWFECSDERVNRLHEAAVWSFRGNACDVPTDCPTRERAGWTGDFQLFIPAAAFLYDVAGFATKWLQALATDQLDDGVVWHCAPNPEPPEFYRSFPPGSAGWGDAAVIVPWELYQAYGDERLLAEQWGSMAAWVGYAARCARDRRHPTRVARTVAAAPHEQYLWDTGFHWGEWLEPRGEHHEASGDETDSMLKDLRERDHAKVATAYLHRSSHLMAKIAEILERPDEQRHYEELAAASRNAWQTEFITGDGRLRQATQADCVRALAFGLLSDETVPVVAEQLSQLLLANDRHLTTGFLATPMLLSVLADNGHLNLAYELLFRDAEPSWMTMVDRGATTVWEMWNGIDDDGVPHGSLNHYSKGAVITFLHRKVGGIEPRPEGPAYGSFAIAPRPGGGLTYARTIHDSPYGRIASEWVLEGDAFVLEVLVPAGTSAEVHLPDGAVSLAAPGRARYRVDMATATSPEPSR